ncbi:hypothetical protein KUTeg_014121 [Tegillarca granosa]|uniref:Uncharacterized protein n=1 Tax=Tegillarca granosa TaxID=220873 RepID=A0ABQ9EVQ0_TEGGR|nr:hypothetical protein KUTeg_014121 [Tegillarca granosa]
MQKSVLSSGINEIDSRRAPLATFDTVDLGEEDVSHFATTKKKLLNYEKLSGSDSVLNHHIVNSNEENLAISGSTSSSEELDSISWKLPDQFMNSGYQKVKNTATPKDVDEEVASLSVESVSQLSSNSDSDSSDSDAGYVKSGYISVKDGKVTKHEFSVSFLPVESSPNSSKLRKEQHTNSWDHIDHCPSKSPLPVLLQELETEKNVSKRKALEKRIQRLQVTINPVDRPRSTTPINVVTLEEYVDISSPERSPTDVSEKLKIKLPGSEFHHKLRSPRKSRGSQVHKESEIFNFEEEHLFTRTKSALLMQNDGTPGNSPKRILIPPNLSPSLTPTGSPVRTLLGASPKLQQKFVYIPCVHGANKNEKESENNWAAFGLNIDSNLRTKNISNSKISNLVSDELGKEGACSNENISWAAQIEEGSHCASTGVENDEVLTVNITENDNAYLTVRPSIPADSVTGRLAHRQVKGILSRQCDKRWPKESKSE